VAGRIKVIKIIRIKVFQETLTTSILKKPSLKPNGIPINRNVKKSIIDHIQSLLLGKIKTEFIRRDFIREVKLPNGYDMAYEIYCYVKYSYFNFIDYKKNIKITATFSVYAL